jgi:YggT family protein
MIGLSLGAEIATFLVEVVFSLYITAVLLRLLLGYARASFHNPLSQFLVKITNPILVPMRRFIPSVGSIDTSAILLAFLLMLLKTSLLLFISTGDIHFPGTLIVTLGELVKAIIWIYIFALIIQAITSWIGSTQNNPVLPLVNSLTAPILKPVRKIVPLIGMMDLSPLVVILGLNILLIIVNNLFR